VFYGTERDYDKPVVVGTWQSLSKLPPAYLATFDVVIADEAHQFKADVVSGLIKNCVRAGVRIGTTGTLDGKILSAIYLQGLFGTTYKTISIRELIDRGSVANPIINCLVLKHIKKAFEDLNTEDYQEELDWVVTNVPRMKFMTNLASKCKGNTVVLFHFVEKHGKPLYEMMKQHLKNKTVLYISGEVDLEDREDIKELFKIRDDIVLICSYGTMSTGVSIKKIDHLMLGSPVKSRIRLWQTIGRALRLYTGKINAYIYDISDDLRKKKKINHTFRHAKERALEYENEKIDFTIHEIDMTRYY
jgi:superfamily II DNA or RNA helicase